MRWAWLALVAACSKHEDAPIKAKPPAGPASTEQIPLPAGAGEPVGTATSFVRFVDGALVEITSASVFGDRSKPFAGLDGANNLHAGGTGFTRAPAHEPLANTAPTALFVDREESAMVLRAAVGGLKGHCWGFAVADHGKLELLLPNPCPPAARNNSQVNLDLYVTSDGKAAAHLSSTKEDLAFATLDELEAFLVAQKASVYFAGRTDLDMAVDGEVTVAQLVDVIERAHKAGFISAAWVGHTREELRELTR